MNTEPKWIPLKVWAKRIYGDFAPHKNTLLRWANDGHIQPQPAKQGKKWFFHPNAQYKGD